MASLTEQKVEEEYRDSQPECQPSLAGERGVWWHVPPKLSIKQTSDQEAQKAN